MKKLFLFFFTPIISLTAFAQTFQVKGLAKTDANEAASFATVRLKFSKDSSIAKVDMADVNGAFKLIGLLPESYFLEVSAVGYEKYISKKFQLVDADINWQEIILTSSSNELKEVTVKAIKPIVEVLADKTVFNVEGTLSATGTSGFELLRKAPGVIIDNSENLIVEGKTGVQIFIDGRLSPLQGRDLTDFLKTIQASDIEAIEIITQPSSKYDAAGNAGIVNIKLKKDKRFGTNGTLAAGFGQGIYSKYNTSLSLNNRNRKTNFFGNYSNRWGLNRNFINLYRLQNQVEFDAQSESISDMVNHNLKLGADFFLTKTSTLGLIINGNLNNGSWNNDSRTPIRPLSSPNPTLVLVARSLTDMNTSNWSGNINYKFADTLGHELNVDADYGIYTSIRFNQQPNIYYNGDESQILFERNFNMDTPTDVSIATFKVDYEQNLLGGKGAIGAKMSSVNTLNSFEFFNVVDGNEILDPTQSNAFDYTERVYAAYLNYNKRWEKWNAQAGIRMEHTYSLGDLRSLQENPLNTVERNYTNWFPSGGLTFTPNRTNSYGFTYSRRIQRPNYQSLNPFQC